MTDEELIAFVAEGYRRATEAPLGRTRLAELERSAIEMAADMVRGVDPRHKLHGDGGRKT